jgi:protein-S-isoprenylcysteine O-methyltransferase Ste14
MIGIGVALDNWLSLLATLLLPPLGVLVRIHEEEAMLERALGDQYRSCAARTRRLVPGVW